MKKAIFVVCLLMATMFAAAQTLTKSGESYLYEGDLISQEEMVSMLQLKCPVAYEQFLTGQKLQHIGRGLWIAGIPTTITGLGMMVGGIVLIAKNGQFNPNQQYDQTRDRRFDLAGGLLCGFGALVFGTGISLELANIPLQIVGAHKRNTAYEEYNEKCGATEESISLNLQTSSDGLGLALRF